MKVRRYEERREREEDGDEGRKDTTMKRKQRQTKINENAPCQQGELFRLRVII